MFKAFSYRFNKGPLSKNRLREEKFKEGNCRLAIQYYFFKKHNLYLNSNEVLNPKAYKKTGTFVVEEGSFSKKSVKKLKSGDIIYAERLKNKNGVKIYKKASFFSNKNTWIISLHSAVYLGRGKIYHSSSISDGSSVWDIEKFYEFYKPVAAKRILDA